MCTGGAIELTLTGVSSDSNNNSTDCNTTNSSSGEGRHCKWSQPGSWNRLGLALTLPYSMWGTRLAWPKLVVCGTFHIIVFIQPRDCCGSQISVMVIQSAYRSWAMSPSFAIPYARSVPRRCLYVLEKFSVISTLQLVSHPSLLPPQHTHTGYLCVNSEEIHFQQS